MNTQLLQTLINSSEQAPQEFRETIYWDKKRKNLLKDVAELDLNELRSGKFPSFAAFGYNEFIKKRSLFRWGKIIGTKVYKTYVKKSKKEARSLNPFAPYFLEFSDVREMAYKLCEVYGELTNSVSISEIQSSRFGNPQDVFEMEGRVYTMAFLNYYLRYCFVNQNMGFKGDEVIVELGSGSGHQIEVLKKANPDLTILCFDLPVPLFLCNQYLTNVLSRDSVVPLEETSKWNDLSGIQKGKVHFFGNWQFPLLKNFKFDLFWNAASFGEMEPDVVKNYLSYILDSCNYIYLLQIRERKSLLKAKRAEKNLGFGEYASWLQNYDLVKIQDAYRAYKRMTETGGYFEALWKLKNLH